MNLLHLFYFYFFFFFFNDTATTEIYTGWYTLSLHDALPISPDAGPGPNSGPAGPDGRRPRSEEHTSELQSHHPTSYAVFCLKKKKTNNKKNYDDRRDIKKIDKKDKYTM